MTFLPPKLFSPVLAGQMFRVQRPPHGIPLIYLTVTKYPRRGKQARTTIGYALATNHQPKFAGELIATV
jgi:hypothetical protein